MIDMFRHDLDRSQTYMVLRALDAYIVKMTAMGEDMGEPASARAVARDEAEDAKALRRKMAEGL